jgi:Tol biopolymer transport system component
MNRRAVTRLDSAAPGAAGRPVLACLFVLLVASSAAAQLAKTEAGAMSLVYFDGTESYLVPHATQSCLNSLAFQKRIFDFDPKDKVTILLADFSDSGDGGASVSPRNRIVVQIAPLCYAFETIAANDRLILIMNHELVHVATMDRPAGPDRFFRHLFFGKVATLAEHPETAIYGYVTAPRANAPRWFHEGIAVFSDTWMAGGIGRAQGGWDEMVFRSMVRDNATFYDPLGLASEGTKIDFQLQINAYLYGARFVTWLAHRYSPEKVVEWAARRDGSKGYYASQFRRVFNRSIEDAWAEWIAFEKDFQQRNLQAIRKYPATAYRDISPRALGSVSRAFYDQATGRIYAAFNYPGVVAYLGAIRIDGGSVERIVDVKDPAMYTVTSLAWDPDSHTLFYTTDNNAFRDIVSVDQATGRRRVLQKDARIGDLAFNRADRSLWGIRHLNGIATLVRIPPPYTDWKQIYSFPYGTVPYDLDVSPDGARLSASFGEVDGQQNVRVFDVKQLLAGDVTPVAQFDFGRAAVPSSFVFSPDGRFLYGSAYYTGVSNIYRYEIATKKVDAVTNAETGFFRPLPLGGDDLIVFRYSGQGFVPARITAAPVNDLGSITFLGQQVVEEHPVLKDWNVTTAPSVSYETIEKHTSPYHLAGGLQMESAYPIVQGYKDSQAIGYRVNLSDPLQINRLALVASYSPTTTLAGSERVHLRAEYERYDWTVRATLNNADFYDLFGPTKTGRKGYVFGVTHKSTLIYDEPRRLDLELGGNVSGNLDRLPAYQNVPVTVTRLAVVDAKLNWTNTRGSMGRVDDEKGQKASLVAEADRVDGRTVGGLYGTFDVGLPLPIEHSSVWVRSAAGASPNDAGNLFANFYFGGFGNNWVDHRTEKRYREFYSFPGTTLNAIGGRNFARSTIEWNLPPWRYRRLGTPGFYLTWMRPAIFVGALATNLDAAPIRHVATDVGAQLDFRFTVLHQLDMTLSVGGAAAFERGQQARREAMVSLRVLR